MGQLLNGEKYFRKARIFAMEYNELYLIYKRLRVRKAAKLKPTGDYSYDDIEVMEARLEQIVDDAQTIEE